MPEIEYFGVNVKDGVAICEKYYYFITDNDLRPIFPESVSRYLIPFDTCSRNETKYSVSYYVKNRTESFFNELISYLNSTQGLNIDASKLFADFAGVSYFEDDSHYDPIFSVQVEGCHIVKASFYVNTVPDKSLCPLFFKESVSAFGIILPSLIECMEDLMRDKVSIMFLSSWDYETSGESHHKLYLKVKDPDKFSQKLEFSFPGTMPYLRKEGYKLSCMAFSLEGPSCDHLNIYFKPL